MRGSAASLIYNNYYETEAAWEEERIRGLPHNIYSRGKSWRGNSVGVNGRGWGKGGWPEGLPHANTHSYSPNTFSWVIIGEFSVYTLCGKKWHNKNTSYYLKKASLTSGSVGRRLPHWQTSPPEDFSIPKYLQDGCFYIRTSHARIPVKCMTSLRYTVLVYTILQLVGAALYTNAVLERMRTGGYIWRAER